MLRLAALPDAIQQTAGLLHAILSDGNGAGAVSMLRPFSVDERIAIGLAAIALGSDRESVALAIKAAANTPIEVQATETVIEMDPVVRAALKPAWWKSTTVQVVGVVAAAIGGWLYFQRQKSRS